MDHQSASTLSWKFLGRIVLLISIVVILFCVVLMRKRGKVALMAADANGNPVGVLPSRARLLSETSPESVEQSIAALPAFIDWALATASVRGTARPNQSYGEAQVVFPRLNRVRKLLAQIDDGRKPHFTGVFLRKIDECMAGFADSRKEFLDRLNRTGGFSTSEPMAYDRKRCTAGPLVYILTQWDRRDALPAFKRILELPDPIVVNRLFLLYSCHLLEAVPKACFRRPSPSRSKTGCGVFQERVGEPSDGSY